MPSGQIPETVPTTTKIVVNKPKEEKNVTPEPVKDAIVSKKPPSTVNGKDSDSEGGYTSVE